MTYKILSLIRDCYQGEEGKSRHRKETFANLEGILQSTLGNAKRAADFARGTQVAKVQPWKPDASSGTSRVSALRKFHEGQQVKHQRSRDMNAEVIRVRQWLFRQGAKVSADGKINWSQSLRTVVYDRDINAQEMSRIEIRNGQLIKSDGQPLDTNSMVTAFSGPGHAIYVMSQEGNLHVGSHSVGHRHHSSLLAGSAVAGAGELRATNGRLEWLSNKSGHYCPDALQLLQTIHRLRTAGVKNPFKITFMDAARNQSHHDGTDHFIRAHHFDDRTVESLQQIGTMYRALGKTGNSSGYGIYDEVVGDGAMYANGGYGVYTVISGLVYRPSKGNGLVGELCEANQPGRGSISNARLETILKTATSSRLHQRRAA